MTSLPRAQVHPIGDWQRRSGIAQDVLLVLLSGFFAFTHLQRLTDGQLTSVFFAAEQLFLVVMFLTRRRSDRTSNHPLDWLVATLGGWLPLAYQPVDDVGLGLSSAGSALQFGGLVLTLIGFAYLGKSFGVVAADRGVKINGPYRLIRHPIYFSHFLTTTGFLVANPSLVNAALHATIWACQLLRIRAEERILNENADYRAYRERVHWRLIPGVF